VKTATVFCWRDGKRERERERELMFDQKKNGKIWTIYWFISYFVVLTEKKRRDKESCKQSNFCNKKKKELWCFTVYINSGALLNFLICLDVLGNFHYD